MASIKHFNEKYHEKLFEQEKKIHFFHSKRKTQTRHMSNKKLKEINGRLTKSVEDFFSFFIYLVATHKF